MNFLIGLLLFVEAICAFLLVAIILMQKPKNEGLGMAFGAEMGENLFGARASNILVKITIWLTVVFLANTTFLTMLYSRRGDSAIMDKYIPAAVPMQQPVMPSPAAPVGAPAAPIEVQPVAPVSAAPESLPGGQPQDVMQTEVQPQAGADSQAQ